MNAVSLGKELLSTTNWLPQHNNLDLKRVFFLPNPKAVDDPRFNCKIYCDKMWTLPEP